jgi:amidophosphoribosyltransferase
MGQLHSENVVRQVYKTFSTQEISDKIAELIHRPISAHRWKYLQTNESLHEACPTNTGDWYFG